MIIRNYILLFILLITLSACGAKVRNGGYSLRPYQIDDLKRVKNKQEALQIVGSPSSKLEIFNGNNKDEIWRRKRKII